MILDDVVNSGAIPTLELAMRFAGRRQTILAHNIANLDTPNFQPRDVSTSDFQKLLGEAIDRRREKTGGERGPLEWQETREIRQGPGGSLRLNPRTPSSGILFHDRNNRDLERMMQDLAENVGVFRVTTDLLRSQFSQIKDAIGERV
jgi:flagellar basal-body rod protein FlgB